MASQAKVTSTEALERFRASLIIFLGKANRSLDDVSDEARGMRQWLTHNQRTLWEGELRKRARTLAQAEQELMTARLAKNQETARLVRQAAVNKAKHAVVEAEDKLRAIKGWSQNYDAAADPIIKRLEGLRQLLDNDMPKAIAYLVNVQRALAAYSSSPSAETTNTAAISLPAAEETAKPE